MGSAAIEVSMIFLHGRTHDVKHMHSIASRTASSHSLADSSVHRTRECLRHKRAGARRTHSVPRLDRLPNDSGSAVIGVFSIVLQGRTHDVAQAHQIASRTASGHSPADSNVHRTRKCRTLARRCPADAQ